MKQVCNNGCVRVLVQSAWRRLWHCRSDALKELQGVAPPPGGFKRIPRQRRRAVASLQVLTMAGSAVSYVSSSAQIMLIRSTCRLFGALQGASFGRQHNELTIRPRVFFRRVK